MKSGLVRSIFLGVLSVVSLQAGMTIDEAWTAVEAKSAALQAVNYERQRAEKLEEAAGAMYLPSLTLNGTATHLDKPIELDLSRISDFLASLPVPIPFPSAYPLSEQDIFTASLDLLWPLYTGGRIDAAQDAYRAKKDEAAGMAQMEGDKLFLKLVEVYYGVVLTKAVYRTRTEAREALALHYRHAKKMFEQGQISKVELLNAQVKHDDALIEETKAKHEAEIAADALAMLTRSDEFPASALFVNAPSFDEALYVEETLRVYPGLAVLQAKSDEVDALMTVENAAYLPEVFAYGNYMLYKDDSVLMEMAPQWFAGVGVKFDLLSRDGRSEKVAAAKLLKSRVGALTEEARRELRLLVQKSYKEMQQHAGAYAELDSSLALAEENRKLRNIAFDEGLSTSVEVVDAELFLTAVKTRRLNSAYRYILSLARLSVLSGNREQFLEQTASAEEVRQ